MKVRQGVYDDYTDYYDRAPPLPQVIGFEGAGIIESVGPECQLGFKAGDEVYYVRASPFRQGSNAAFVLVDERIAAHKPKSLGFTEAAGIPLTGLTTWECLLERLEIKKGEQCGILIVNGAGGVGSIASQIARRVLNLPVVITTASRPQTRDFSLETGQATHVVNHHGDIVQQIKDLKLNVRIRYCFITHTPTDHYVKVAARSWHLLGGCAASSRASSRSMALLRWPNRSPSPGPAGTKAYYKLGGELVSLHNALEELARYLDEKNMHHHVTTRLPIDGERDSRGPPDDHGQHRDRKGGLRDGHQKRRLWRAIHVGQEAFQSPVVKSSDDSIHLISSSVLPVCCLRIRVKHCPGLSCLGAVLSQQS